MSHHVIRSECIGQLCSGTVHTAGRSGPTPVWESPQRCPLESSGRTHTCWRGSEGWEHRMCSRDCGEIRQTPQAKRAGPKQHSYGLWGQNHHTVQHSHVPVAAGWRVLHVLHDYNNSENTLTHQNCAAINTDDPINHRHTHTYTLGQYSLCWRISANYINTSSHEHVPVCDCWWRHDTLSEWQDPWLLPAAYAWMQMRVIIFIMIRVHTKHQWSRNIGKCI